MEFFPIFELPSEICCLVLTYIPDDLPKVARVCQIFRALVENVYLETLGRRDVSWFESRSLESLQTCCGGYIYNQRYIVGVYNNIDFKICCSNRGIQYIINKNENIISNRWLFISWNSNYDLMSKYSIYKNRLICQKLKCDYAKSKLLLELETTRLKIYMKSPRDIWFWHMYIMINALVLKIIPDIPMFTTAPHITKMTWNYNDSPDYLLVEINTYYPLVKAALEQL